MSVIDDAGYVENSDSPRPNLGADPPVFECWFVGTPVADRKRTQKWHFEHRPWNYARKAVPKRPNTAKNRIRKPLQPKPEAEIWRKPRQ